MSEIISDEELVQAVVAGSVNKYEVLVMRHQHFVFSLVRRHVPPSAVAEVAHLAFVRAFKSLAKFSGSGVFQAWLSRIVARQCCDFWRDEYRRRKLIVPEKVTDEGRSSIEFLLDSNSFTEHQLNERQRGVNELLDFAMAKLSSEERMLLSLVYFDDWTVKDAAIALEISVINAKVRLHRARNKLKASLSQILDIEGDI